MKEDRDPHVTTYLDSFVPRRSERIKCCGSARALFCFECCRILEPTSAELPSCIRDGSLKLPFDLHILLDDKRATATGLHAMALLGKEQVSLTDIQRDEPDIFIEKYRDCGQTYVLFPAEDSVPISSVKDISTLVVLDCKWTRTAPTKSLATGLPRVHLSNPPTHSHFWRSHTAQQGYLSTIEAIYYAALEVDPSNSNLIHLLWLFARQRAAIQAQGPWKGRSMPFTEDGKEAMRALRRRET
jgi:hypothetical protein